MLREYRTSTHFEFTYVSIMSSNCNVAIRSRGFSIAETKASSIGSSRSGIEGAAGRVIKTMGRFTSGSCQQIQSKMYPLECEPKQLTICRLFNWTSAFSQSSSSEAIVAVNPLGELCSLVLLVVKMIPLIFLLRDHYAVIKPITAQYQYQQMSKQE